VAEEVIGPVIIEGTPREVYATGVAIVAGNDCDIGDGGGVGQREENKQNGDGEESYPMIISPSPSTLWPGVELRLVERES